jgi:hypothetical protein
MSSLFVLGLHPLVLREDGRWRADTESIVSASCAINGLRPRISRCYRLQIHVMGTTVKGAAVGKDVSV